jgi:hypothetical protein
VNQRVDGVLGRQRAAGHRRGRSGVTSQGAGGQFLARLRAIGLISPRASRLPAGAVAATGCPSAAMPLPAQESATR